MARSRFLLAALLGACLAPSGGDAHPMLDEQLARAEAVVAQAPSDARAWVRVAQLHRYRREWGDAEAAYARARALPGAPAELDLELARMHVEAGRPEEALAPLFRYLTAHPADPEAWHARGEAMTALGRNQQAVEAYAAALARSASTRPALPDTYL